MHILDKVIFCDPPKTGSTYVSDFLDLHCPGGTRFISKHNPVPKKFCAGAEFILATVRDPVTSYISTYKYGMGKPGGKSDGRAKHNAFNAMLVRLHGKAFLNEVYALTQAGFEKWCHAMFKFYHPNLIRQGYPPSLFKLYGYLSFMTLRATMVKGSFAPVTYSSRPVMWRHFSQCSLPDLYLRQPYLTEDLSKAVRGPLGPFMRDRDAALAYLENTPPSNTTRLPNLEITVPAELAKKINEREWFLYKLYRGINRNPDLSLGARSHGIFREVVLGRVD